jgi:hypothetical protein
MCDILIYFLAAEVGVSTVKTSIADLITQTQIENKQLK